MKNITLLLKPSSANFALQSFKVARKNGTYKLHHKKCQPVEKKGTFCR